MTHPVRRGPRRGERGMVGGGDGLVFGALVLVAGSLALLNVWAMVETRVALDAAARDYLRSYTEQSEHAGGATAGERAARNLLRERGTPMTGVRIVAPDPATFGPCSSATVELIATVPAARLPFLDDLGDREVRIVHQELIDPHREVIPGARYERRSTPCWPG